jgi:hypothetical protein
MLEGKVSVDLEVGSEAFNCLEADVIQSSPVFQVAVSNEILGRLLIARLPGAIRFHSDDK